MQAFFEWLFADFWRYLMFVIILIIAVQWKPIHIELSKVFGREERDDED